MTIVWYSKRNTLTFFVSVWYTLKNLFTSMLVKLVDITSTVVNNCEIQQSEKQKERGFGHWSLDEHEQTQTSLIFHPPTIFEWFTIGSVTEPLEEAIATAYSSLF